MAKQHPGNARRMPCFVSRRNSGKDRFYQVEKGRKIKTGSDCKMGGNEGVMNIKYDSLSLCTLTPEQNRSTCDYWFLVHNNNTSHTAFNQRTSLLIWLEERGLELTGPLPEHATHSVQKIKGNYSQKSHMSYDEFYGLPAISESRTLSNGDYVLSRITDDGEGRTVHTLNPNCKHRKVYNYQESRAFLG